MKTLEKLSNGFRKLIQKIATFQASFTPAKDKLGHFFWGFIYGLLGVIIEVLSGNSAYIILCPLAGGLFKEVADHFRDKTFDWKDLLYTTIPGVGLFVVYLLS